MAGTGGETAFNPGYVRKALTGLHGFDSLAGGIPAGRMTLIFGGAGSGKTVFALQTLVNGWQMYGEAGVFVSFEEDTADLLAQASRLGWTGSRDGDGIRMFGARPSVDSVLAGDFDLHAMLAGFGSLVDNIGARRIIFDSLDALLVLLDDVSAERREFFRAYMWAKERGLTTIFTAKSDPGTRQPQQGFLEYLADCAIAMDHRLSEGTSVRGLRIAKCRGTAHSANEFPLVLDSRGIQLSNFTSAKLHHEVFLDRLSSGVERLDAMLGGGYHRGSAILISGAPGTSKTSLAGAFVEAACARGDIGLFVSFDESEGQIIRNLRSINIDLEPHVKSGKLTIEAFRTGILSAEESFMHLRDELDAMRPDVLVVDSLASLSQAGGLLLGIGVIERLLDYAKAKGITLLLTTLMERGIDAETTRNEVSTVSDTWINVSFRPLGGERNRALTIIKSRGTAHSHQVRELILSSSGITLADVYSAGGEVLMGTARFEKERQNALLEMQRKEEHLRSVAENAAQQKLLRASLADLERKLAVTVAEGEGLEKLESLRLDFQKDAQEQLLGVRAGGKATDMSSLIPDAARSRV